LLLERYATKITDVIIALTKQEKNDYIDFRVAKESKLRVIHSGIELDKFKEPDSLEKTKAQNNLGIPEKATVVGTAGRLVPVKGPEYLLKAAKYVLSSYPDTVFVFAGDGPLWKILEKKAFELDISKNVYFLGWKKNIRSVMSMYDIFVLPSLNEGMGRVLIEAMNLGKPIVASNIGGILDLISHGKNGYLVSAKNPVQLANSIKTLIENKEIRHKMGEEGKKKAESFTAEIMVKKIKELYKELMEIQSKYAS
jgi:glycosyltransferase involved in cell wall biosynthesis